jgi:hypothetical protein
MFQTLTRRIYPRWLLALCLATLLSPAWALKRVALVIGNSKYAVESRLANPVNDAQLIARTLRGQGFTVDIKTDLPKRAMELAIASFVRQSAGADSAVLYYAGHGAQPANGGRNFLLPVDARVDGDDTLETDGIAADRIVEQMERSANPAKIRLVVLDACRNNRMAGKTRSSVRGLARMSPGDDFTLIAFSTNDQDVALDGNGSNSPYAKALSTYLEKSNELPLRRIFELTATDVRTATGQKQKPRTYGDLDSRTLLDGTQIASLRAEPVGSTAERAREMSHLRPVVDYSYGPIAHLSDGTMSVSLNDVRTMMLKTCEEGSEYVNKRCVGEPKLYTLEEAHQAAEHANRSAFAGYTNWLVPNDNMLLGMYYAVGNAFRNSKDAAKLSDEAIAEKLFRGGLPSLNTWMLPRGRKWESDINDIGGGVTFRKTGKYRLRLVRFMQ